MRDTLLNRYLFGGLFILIGLALIIFHEQYRKFGDALNKHDPLLRWGDWWTGKYSRGGLIFARAATILFGIFLLVLGVLIIFRVVG
jgi:hypothetical protein